MTTPTTLPAGCTLVAVVSAVRLRGIDLTGRDEASPSSVFCACWHQNAGVWHDSVRDFSLSVGDALEALGARL